MAASSIGAFTFISLSPFPRAPLPQFDLEFRSGRNGCTVWAIGTHPEPFQVATLRDCVNLLDAKLVISNYSAAVGGAPVALVHNGVTWGYPVLILDVEPLEVTATIRGVGGILGNSTGLVRARWTLLPFVTS